MSKAILSVFFVLFFFFVILLFIAPHNAFAGPRISAIYPDRGPKVGNTTIVISGENFSSDDKVTLWGGGTYIKGAHPTTGPANSIYCYGSYAFLACGIEKDPNSQGLHIFDVEDPAQPKPVAFFPLPGKANDVLVVGDYAYVAAMDAGLQILDVHNPVLPSPVTYRLVPGKALKLSVYQSNIYIASDYGGLQIININNPEIPEIIGEFPVQLQEYVLDVFVEGDYAYLATGWDGLKIIDISDPSAPKMVSGYSPGRYILGVDKNGDYLYLSAMENGVDILDVSDPLSPGFVSRFDTPGIVHNVYSTQEYIYVTDDYFGIEIIKNEPQNYKIIGFQATPGWAIDLKVFNEHIFVADSLGGLQIIDAHNLRNPSIVSIVDLMDNATGIQVNGLYLYEALQETHICIFSKSFTSQKNWLKILNVSDPKNPQLYGIEEDIGSNPEDMVVTQGFAYSVDKDDGLQVFNVTDIRNPQRLPFYDNDSSGGKGICFGNNRLFLADTSANDLPMLKIFSLDLKMIPAMTSQSLLNNTAGKGEALLLLGDYVFMAAGAAGIEVFDINTIHQPAPFYINLPLSGYINDITLTQGFVCISNKEKSIHSVNIQNVAHPVLADTCIIAGEPHSLSARGNYLYVAEGMEGLQVIEIGEQGGLCPVASTHTLTSAEDVMVDSRGEFVYVAIENGMMVMDALKPCPAIEYIDSTSLEVTTPSGLSPGTYNVTVTAPNGKSTVFYNGFTVGENHCPYIFPVSDLDIKTVVAGTKVEFNIDAYDEDNDPLTYSVSLHKLPAGATLNGNTFSWTPKITDIGFYPAIQLQVSDDECSYTREIMIIVLDTPNTPPVLDPIGDKEVSEGALLSFPLSATDEEGDPLLFSASNLPDGAALLEDIFYWVPDYTQSGTYTITLIITEQISDFTDSEEITISVHNTNRPPYMSLPESINGTEGVTISFIIEVSDPDPEDISSLELVLPSPPEGARLQKLFTGPEKAFYIFLWTPTLQQQGAYATTFKAYDQHGDDVQDNMFIDVLDVSVPYYTVQFNPGMNIWISPEGQGADYTSFDFLRERGQECIASLKLYDWDSTPLYESYWFLGKPCGDDFPMDKSQMYVIYAKKTVSFVWP